MAEVERLVGQPLLAREEIWPEVWYYCLPGADALFVPGRWKLFGGSLADTDRPQVRFDEKGRVSDIVLMGRWQLGHRSPDLQQLVGIDREQVRRTFGEPLMIERGGPRMRWDFSRPRAQGRTWIQSTVYFADGRLARKVSRLIQE